MRTIAHNAKTFRREFRSVPTFVLKSRIFVLVAAAIFTVLSAITLFLYSYVYLRSTLYQNLPFWVLICEVPLIMGFAQLAVEADRRRFKRNHPGVRVPGFRQVFAATDRDKRMMIAKHFGQREDFGQLAKDLIEQWEWQKEIDRRAGDNLSRKALHFFRWPSAGNFATYLGGLLAVVAAIIVALIDKDNFYSGVPDLWPDFLQIGWFLIQVLVLPFAALVFPLACCLDGITTVVLRSVERINDDYLSQRSFYSFIKQLLELEQHKERRRLMTTTGWAYWSFRIGTAPLCEIRRLWKKKNGSVQIAKRRRSRQQKL